jgi:hypothetical protein
MLVQAELERFDTNVVNALQLLVLALKRKDTQRIIARINIYLDILKRLIASQLRIAQTEASEVTEIIVISALGSVIKYKSSTVNFISYPTVDYMLAVAKLDILHGRRIEFYVVNSNRLLAKVEQIAVFSVLRALYQLTADSFLGNKLFDRTRKHRKRLFGCYAY